MAAVSESKRPGRSRWLVRTTKSLFVITDHPRWTTAPQNPGTVHFLGLSRDTGGAREGSDSPEGLEGKLKGLSGAGGTAASEVPAGHSCAAVLGVLTAHQEAFLLLATEVAVVFECGPQRIFEILRCEALPFAASDPSAEAAAALAGVKQLLERNFYFSEGFDLTRRLQHRLLAGDEAVGDGEEVPLLRADERFVWNRQLVAPLLCQGVSQRWFTPVMQGFVQAREVPPLLLLLVARRSCRRAGTRYNARGLDDEGEVGNWVETEQLVQVRAGGQHRAQEAPFSGWLALVQVRGSAPVFWEQPSSMSAITVTRGRELGAVAFDKHIQLLRAEYGDVLLVSLLSGAVSKKESEGVLTTALAEQLPMHPGVQLAHLDFHARVSGEDGNFDRELDGLADEVAGHLQRFGFLDASSPFAIASQQTGVVRTNCFDCLDRTNILQYQIVWRWLLQYCKLRPDLRAVVERPAQPAAREKGASLEGFFMGKLNEIMAPEEVPHAPLQSALRGIWADLGDALSEQYTGTASTMGAALRQGGQNTFTLIEKGWRSVNRAYCARFGDEARQAALELLLGKHKLLRAPTGQPEARRAPCGQLHVAIITWNLHGHKVWESPGALMTLLQGTCAPSGQKAPDIVIFCFQEFLELTAENVVLRTTGDEERQTGFESAATEALGQALGEAFVKVRSVGMVGLYVGAFVAERLRSSIAGVAGDRTRVGLYGQAGNKGAVAVRFEVAKTAVCAMSLHLESGGGKASERAAQLREVLQGCFAPGGPSRVSMTPAKHDLLLLGGDFNFRLALPQASALETVRGAFDGSWPRDLPPTDAGSVGEGVSPGHPQERRCQEVFASYDELMGSQSSADAKDVLREEGLMEGPVLFPPTYKFSEASQVYDLERVPAWCDRVIHSKVGVVRRRYCALAAMTHSDHRPVAALLETQLLALPAVSSTAAAQQPTLTQQPTPSPQPSLQPQKEAQAPQTAEPQADLLSFQPSSPPAPSQSQSQRLSQSQNLGPAAANNASSSPVATTDLLGGDSPSRSPNASADLQRSPAHPAPKPAAAPPPGHPPTPGSLAIGQLVLAHFSNGWYYANVTRATSTSCDVAWLRPQATQWGSDQMSRYLCSTGADETLHGENLALASHIRIPDELPTGPQAKQQQPPLVREAEPDLLGDGGGGGGTGGGAPVDLLG